MEIGASHVGSIGASAEPMEIVARRSRDVKHFDLEGGLKQAVFAPFTHYQDDQGTWQDVDLNFTFDGLDRLIDKHLINYRADASGLAIWHKPTGFGIKFLFPRRPDRVVNRTVEWDLADGTTWRLTARKTGLKTEATVVTRRGPRTYTFSGQMLGGLAPPNPDANGNLVQPGGHFTIQRPAVHGADDVVYATSGWSRVGGNISFDFDDTSLPDEALPYVIDPTTTFNVAASGDDGHRGRFDTVYLPDAGTANGNTTAPTIEPGKIFDGDFFEIKVGLIRWDTSNLPDDATIDSATFRAHVVSKQDANSRSLTAEWYESGVIDAADYTSTVGTDAHGGTTIASITTGADNDFALTNLTNVNKTGYTGLRLHISGGQPTGLNQVILASFDHATLTEPRLIVTYTEGGVTVTPATAALVIAAFVPAVLAPRLATPPTKALSLTAFAPTVVVGHRAVPGTAALSLTAFAPTATATANQTATPGTAALVLSAFAPNVLVAGVSEGLVIGDPTSFVGEGHVGAPTVVSEHVVVTPGMAILVLAPFAPTVSAPRLVIPPTLSLTITGIAPSVIVGIRATPSTATLTTTAFAPTIQLPKLATPGVRALTIATFAPMVSAPRTATPGTASLTLTTFAPTVTASAGLTLTPATASLTLAPFAPTVTAPRTAVPATAVLTLTTFVPTVSAPRNVVPPTAVLSVTTFAPTVTVSAGLTVTPATATLALTTFAPTVTAGAAVSVSPATRALVLSTFAPTVLAPSIVTPGVLVLSLATFAPSVSAPRRVAPATLVLVLATFAPTVVAPRTVTPTTLALVLAFFAPSVAVAGPGRPILVGGTLDVDSVASGALDADTLAGATLDIDTAGGVLDIPIGGATLDGDAVAAKTLAEG